MSQFGIFSLTIFLTLKVKNCNVKVQNFNLENSKLKKNCKMFKKLLTHISRLLILPLQYNLEQLKAKLFLKQSYRDPSFSFWFNIYKILQFSATTIGSNPLRNKPITNMKMFFPKCNKNWCHIITSSKKYNLLIISSYSNAQS